MVHCSQQHTATSFVLCCTNITPGQEQPGSPCNAADLAGELAPQRASVTLGSAMTSAKSVEHVSELRAEASLIDLVMEGKVMQHSFATVSAQCVCCTTADAECIQVRSSTIVGYYTRCSWHALLQSSH